MDEKKERVLGICDEREKAEVMVLDRAVLENLKNYKMDQSSTRLKDWQAAKGALEETVDRLWAKYFNTDEPFKDRMEALAWLQSEGYKIKKSKLYKDTEKGLLKVQADGSVQKNDVLAYIVLGELKRVEDKSGKLLDDQAEKVRLENKKLNLTNESLQFNLDKERGLYVRRSDVETEFAAKIGVFDAGFKHTIRIKSPDWVFAVGGDPKLAGVLENLICGVVDELLNEMGKNEELGFTLQKGVKTEVLDETP